jgi:hypothetical protein
MSLPAKREEQPFRFLDLSAGKFETTTSTTRVVLSSTELRIRVYDYAAEDCNAREYAPMLRKAANKPYEYRPLWMRAAAVRLNFISETIRYLAACMPNEADLKHAPKLLQIAWEHDMEKTTAMRDITPLLRIRAFSSSFYCRFVPYNVVMEKAPEWDMCHFCSERYELEEHDMDMDRNMWTECTCPPMDLEVEEWVEWYTDQMEYMGAISDLSHSTNEIWLTNLRANKISVSFAIAEGADNVTFRILYHQKLSNSASASDYHPALELLKKWGVFDLPCGPNVHWIVAYEEEHQFAAEGGLKMKTSAVYEAHFRKAKD